MDGDRCRHHLFRRLEVARGAIGHPLFLSIGAIAAFVASPIVNLLERRGLPRRLRRAPRASWFVLVALLVLFGIAIPFAMAQVASILRDAPSWLSALGSWLVELESKYAVFEHLRCTVQLDSLLKSLGDLFNQVLSGLLSTFRDGVVPMVSNIASTVFIVFLAFVFAYWLVLDYPRINEEICSVLGENRALDYRLMVAVCRVRLAVTFGLRSSIR